MKKVLILGSTGMLGHQVYYKFNSLNKFEIFDISFRRQLRKESIICDITKLDELEKLLVKIDPDYIINCVGILIKGSSEDPANAIFINAYFPHWLASTAALVHAKLIHISTDCVFSGKSGGYQETDYRDADDVYGRSKALGEINDSTNLTLRTSIVGPELKANGEGLFHWFMNQQNTINGFKKSYWGGVTTVELSNVIAFCLDQESVGLINISNGEKISKYDLLNIFKEIFNKKIDINSVDGKEIDKSLISNRNDFKYSVPSYFQMIFEMKKFMEENRNLYQTIYNY
ncbi:dTDP-4-dehydrorhamnose reductase family protein [Cyclobacterium jeungdonense]|uniref:dTDP-4-dehydrorhamnose reductase n=1 Tax=Cyclobacterium jeungdonense TaxID=708087 RepID=A0ABT8C3A7_9BACT|nr:SDR family oxidoreductase [Cyclobacterium jeungdonense]MDN3686517.1 SDR family oxidoreductase [Cyclobacterium jeungdonense]